MRSTCIRRSAMPAALVLGFVTMAVADTYIVPVDFPTIQEAIDAASASTSSPWAQESA